MGCILFRGWDRKIIEGLEKILIKNQVEIKKNNEVQQIIKKNKVVS